MSRVADPFDLTGHVSVVTGGGSGIGLGFASGLARAGASVAVLGRSAERLESAAESLRVHGNAVLPIACDVADEQAITDAMARVRQTWGRLDSCFANAAVDGPFVGLLDTSLEDFRAVTAVNLDGAFLTLREAARQMIEVGDGGSLVVTSSIGARQGMPRQLPYAASKGAVISLVKSLAVDLARHGIRANAVLPGFIDTEFIHELLQSEPMQKRVLPRIPARRWGRGHDFAGLAVYLAGPASSYQSGDTIVLDGGYEVF